MNNLREVVNKKKAISFLIAVVIIIVGFVGILDIIVNTPTTYHYEKGLPDNESRNSRFTLINIKDANITVSFVDEPGLWYRIDVTHYTSVKHHGVESYTKPSILPLRARLMSATPIKTINLVLGTDIVHSLYITGENLNTIIYVDNGANISDSRCRFYSTGVFKFILRENVNFTSKGMDVVIGDPYLYPEVPELVVLDINLPTGLNGHVSTPNASFVQNEWPIKYGDEYGTTSINEPLLDIKIFYSMRVWANLIL